MGKDARRVEVFAKGGVRVIQLTYNGPNQLGDGSTVPANKGLTPFGRDVVAELNRNRILVDLSHSGEQICSTPPPNPNRRSSSATPAAAP
jgi:membrane dipeptidase